MIAKLENGNGGGGDDRARLSEQRVAELENMGAAAAVATLDLPGQADKLPDLQVVTFPGPIAEAFYWCDGSIVAIQGPVGSGKTTTLLKSRLRRAIMMPRSTIDRVRRYKLVVTRKTYRELWSTTIPSYLEVYPKAMGSWSGGRGDPVTHRIIFDDGNGPIEFTVEFMAFGDDIDAAMRGIQATDMWINEADTNPVEVISTGVGRINRWPAREHFAGLAAHLRSYGQIVCDFNAPDEDNWTFSVFHDEEERKRQSALLSSKLPAGTKPITIEFFNQPGFGEPGAENLQNLAPGYYETQIALNKLAGKGDKNDRLVFNKVVYLRVGNPVFAREFNRRIHVHDGPLDLFPGEPLRIGLDQGFKPAAIIAQLVDGVFWRVYAELHFPKESLMAREFGRRLGDLLATPRFGGHRVLGGWGDMAGEHGASQADDENATWNRNAAQAAEISIRPQRIGTNRIQPRLEAVRASLEFVRGGQPGLLIDPSCKFLVRGFEARYVLTEVVDASGDKRKVPDKRYTEANVMDALQYLMLSEVRPDGTSPNSNAHGGRAHGNPSGRPPEAGKAQETASGYDILNPYGA